jgi:23S rRNA (adenine2503-C2)-methyltransferase
MTVSDVALSSPPRRRRDRPTRYGSSRAEIAELLAHEPRYRADQVWDGLYRGLLAPTEMTNLPRQLRGDVDRLLPIELSPVAETVSDAGDTVKFLSAIDGDHQVETVLMFYRDRATVCVSSQAGCAMGCGFCATGQAGFGRQLTTGEIVEQVIVASRRARGSGRRLSNVVFMGMGEPLANEAAVWAATLRIHEDLGLSARHITLSTVGVVPGIRALSARRLPVTLAVSIHAANDALRNDLVPLNRRYPLNALVDACQDYLDATGRRVSFEWAMIDGVNDRPTDAVELADLARRLRPAAHVNLIPLNPTPGWPTMGSPPSRVRQFRDQLATLGVAATVRRNRGTDIDAACGQLAARHRGRVPVAMATQQPAERTYG